ncbi:MAG: DNA polymerase III subunit alpha [Clostridiales bacterium]|nr:DNA polymerase III subunit alpha [Clostridiales bacterium]
MKPFAHLHVHTEFSLLDGAVRTDKVFKLCDELNIPAIAMTDHGNLYGAIEFLKAAVKYTDKEADFLKFMAERRPFKVKPIIGCEVYMTEDMHVKEKGVNGAPPKLNHLILLAKNGEGYHNLIKIVSAGYTEGMYYKPRVDFELIKKHSNGLICLSACIAGVIPQSILKKNFALADEWIKRFKGVFGEDFYIEIQNHNISDQKVVLPHLIRLAQENGVKTVATNDAHYLTKADSKMQKVLMAISFHSTLEDGDDGAESNMSAESVSDDKYFPTEEFYIKSYDEMYAALPYEDALDVTLEIADKCDPYFIKKEPLLPSYTPPDGFTSEQYLRKLTFDGLKVRYGEITEEIRQRAEYELGIVEKLRFVDYFLIVWDFINYAESQGIPVGLGRGSGAGSIVAYAIGITKIDPLKYALIFERFLNPERVSNPDFDIDFCVDRRGEVIDYVTKKYGENNVSQIATFGTMATKAAIKDVGRVFDLPFNEVNNITKMIPRGSEKMHIKDLLGRGVDKEGKPIPGVPEMMELYNNDPTARRVLDMAEKIEGMPRQIGMHAAGVIICRDPIADHVPLSRTNEDVVVTQYDMIVDEELGLLKMDFLGLTTLTDIKKATDYIKETRGVDIDFVKLGYDDPNVYELIGSGNTEAVFQLESGGMKGFMRELQPSSLEDIIAGISLYRPGPMDAIPDFIKNKKAPDKIKYQHPLMKSILGVTYGVIVYQEQVMDIVRTLAGYSMGGADNIRRMMSKKKHEAMEAERKVFINGGEDKKTGNKIPGAVANGVPANVANDIYDMLIKFASYGFNKSHAAAYAHVAYQTAYLKRYYPVEYFTAVLNNRINKLDELTHYLSYLKESKISVLPPNINKSGAEYSVEDGCVRIGMGAIKGVGVPIINKIVEERERNGEYKDFVEFVMRMEDGTGKSLINRRMVESLIYAGAFDCFGKKRAVLIAAFPSVMDKVAKDRAAKISGQLSFFDVAPEIKTEFKYPEVDEYSPNEKYKREKEVAGVYLSGHPLSAYIDKLKQFNCNTSMLNPESQDCPPIDSKITIGGMLTSTVNKMTKKGNPMGTGVLEDLYGTVEVVAFGRTYENIRHLWQKDTVVAVTGTLRQNDNGVTIYVDDITPFTESDAMSGKICCYFSLNDKAKLDGVREIAAFYSGGRDYLYVKNTDDNKLYRLSDKFTIDNLSKSELCAVLGEENVKEQSAT